MLGLDPSVLGLVTLYWNGPPPGGLVRWRGCYYTVVMSVDQECVLVDNRRPGLKADVSQDCRVSEFLARQGVLLQLQGRSYKYRPMTP